MASDRRNAVIKKTPTKPADLNASYDSVMEENRRLKELNADLHSQLTEMRTHKTISPVQEEYNARIAKEHKAIDEEMQAIALWLRDNKEKEIKQGKHMGMKLSEICIMYMARSCE